VPTTLVSWNLKGSGHPDTRAVATYLRDEGADVVVLQEVQWHQARRIARALAARSRHWGFKHWPVRDWPEGMAIIGVTVAVSGRTRPLSHRWRLWSWRRRIFQVAAVQADRPWSLFNVHFTPHGQIGLRAVEAATVLRVVAERSGPVVVAGDLNERPDGAVHRQFAAAGLRDGWAVRLPPHDAPSPPGDAEPGRPQRRSDPWPTNWRGWRRGTTEAPTLRLDYVYATEDVRFVDVHTPGPADVPRFAAISDHLPVTAVYDVK
jgi:endonuclease/exonuclease/phosphatase family metal-dependent hydrolase